MNVYHRGASDGLLMGAYLSVMFLLQIAVVRSAPILMLLGEAMFIGIPILAYALLRRAYRQDDCRSHFSAVWMHGITMFICGSLIMGLVAYVYFRFVNPTCIASLVQMLADFYNTMGTEESVKMGTILQSMISKHMLPTPIAFAFSMMWVGSFLGAMLSLVLAWIVKLVNKKR